MPARVDTGAQQTVLVAKKALNQIKVEGQQTLELIQSANPTGTGTKLNVIA